MRAPLPSLLYQWIRDRSRKVKLMGYILGHRKDMPIVALWKGAASSSIYSAPSRLPRAFKGWCARLREYLMLQSLPK